MTRYMSVKENADARRRAMKAPTSTTFSNIKRKRSGKFENYIPLNARERSYSERPAT